MVMNYKSSSLLKAIYQHIKFYSLANFLGKGANFFIFLLIAKIFSVEEFAEYITLMVVIELLLILLLFGVDSYIMRSQGSFAFDLTLEFIKFNLTEHQDYSHLLSYRNFQELDYNDFCR